MEKRGAGHVEMILAFVLFVGFVGFALFFFRPTNTDRLVDTTLTYAFSEIEKNTSTEMDVFGVKRSEGSPDKIIIRVETSEISDVKNVRAEDVDGNVLPSERNGINVELHWEGEEFAFLKFNEDFDEGNIPKRRGGGPLVHDESYYEIISSNSREVFSEKRFLGLKDSYEQDYYDVKKKFNLPNRVNWGAVLVLSDNVIRMEREIPEGLDVFANSKRLEILRSDGTLEFGELSVKIW